MCVYVCACVCVCVQEVLVCCRGLHPWRTDLHELLQK